MNQPLLREIELVYQNQQGNLYQGDCIHSSTVVSESSLQLVYMDPPFFTQRGLKGNRQEPHVQFEDTWNSKREYVEWLLQRIGKFWRLISPEGSLVVHLDWHAVHAVKVALDDLLGEEHFQNEIIWHYQTGGASSRRFSRKHDNLLWYTRGRHWKFYGDRIRIPRTEKALQRARNPKGARLSVENKDKNPEDVITLPDVLAIAHLNPMSNERTGYPTQKPRELISLLIEALSDPGDVVADFFCGSGTTLLAAQYKGRKWVGMDISADAIRITRERLQHEVLVATENLSKEAYPKSS